MKREVHIFLTILSEILLGISTVYDITSLIPPIFFLVFYIIIRGNYGQVFGTLLCISYYSNCVVINDIGCFFIFPLFATIKNISSYNHRIKYGIWIFVFVFIFIFNQLAYVSFGMTISRISYILYFFSFCYFFKNNKYNHVDIVLLFFISMGLVNTFAIQLSGGLYSFLSSDQIYMRLGSAEDVSKDTLDGTMGFPIQTILMACIILPVLFDRGTKWLFKVFIGLVISTFFIITFLTTSKVYLLGLCTFAICIVLLFLKKRVNFSIILILLCIYLFISTQNWFIDIVYDRYYYRLFETQSGDLTTGRASIYNSCIEFLINNPIVLFIGAGYDSYIEIGRINNFRFQMSAHNIILDGLMSYGLLGLFLMLNALKELRRRVIIYSNCFTSNFIAWIPLICWFVMCMTNSPFMLAKTYFLLPFLVIHTIQYSNLTTK